jgi:flagellar biosynthesis/type III secretory pathway M-ring protein FliF/YscJ
MDALIALLAFVLLAVVVAVIAAPLRASVERPSSGAGEEAESPERAELEAARETKYREIRDAELDFRTGKLSREDFDAIDASLRSEALEILDRLDALDRSATPRDA